MIKNVCALLLLLVCSCALGQESFVVKRIQVEGLQRVPEQTVLEYVPIHVGQSLNPEDTSAIIDALYQTGFFSDVSLSRSGDTLIISVQERSTIGLIKISGNKQIKTKDLLQALKQVGIAEGESYNQATISGMRQALLQQYYALGKYNATVETKVIQQPRDRVELDIHIYEGEIARVKEINIIGNKAFSSRQLRKQFELSTHHWWKFFSKSDEYSTDKLQHDLESLRNFYYDHGYLKFKVISSQVTITPNRKDVYITIRVDEGDVYRIKGYGLTGNLLGEEAIVQKLVTLKRNAIFSRKQVLGDVERIRRYYGNQGYAFAQVNVNPQLDDAAKQVFVDYDVQPGNRVYVRRINFVGNTRTADYVLRRESRQLEGSLYSVTQQEETKRRLNSLGYIEDIQVNMEPVPGTNQVDLTYHVKEASSTTVSAQMGYSDTNGLLYGANVVQKNFRGTGKTVSLGFDNSEYAQTYSFNYFNPYFTTSGISQGFSVYFQQTTPGDTNVAAYTLDAYGAMMNYRFPLSEYDTLSAGFGYEYLNVNPGSSTSTQINDFTQQHGNNFNNAKVTLGWAHNTYDRIVLPTKGFSQWLGGEAGLPILPNALDYYKLSYSASYYQPVWRGVIVALNTELGYGNGYNSFDELPFFKNFYAGGIGTVRGYEANTLGPRDSNNNPLGGSVLTAGSFNLIVPNGISDRLRTSLYFDTGNVYDDSWQFNELRCAAGLEVDWVSPMGPLKLSLGHAINPKPGDNLQVFQFSVGASL